MVSLPAGYFDRLYADSDDPWGFTSRWYERRKRAMTMAALPHERYRYAFEPGASIGLLTADLATRCDRVLATDVSERALDSARARLADRPGVTLERLVVPREWPSGARFDLVVVSELGYYLDADDLAELARRSAGSLDDDGVVLLCHWRHPVADYPMLGDDVHRVFTSASGLEPVVRHLEDDLALEVLARPGQPSVACRGGLVR